MKRLFVNIDNLVTVNCHGQHYKSGKNMDDIGLIENGAILFDKTIIWIGSSEEARRLKAENNLEYDVEIDLSGKTIMPGFVDSHTHIVFGGNRSNEFARRLRGATYQEIADEGGGIQHTVSATRKASKQELFDNAMKLCLSAIKHGSTSLEIKSGYSLDLENEIKQLEVIQMLDEALPINIVSTFMGAHDFPKEYQNDREKYIDSIIIEMIPRVAELKLATFCDAFVDKGYYTTQQAERIFKAADKYGLKYRLHADELADVGAAKFAAEVGCYWADHLLYVSDEGISALAKSKTVATLLPGTAYFIRLPYAPARKLIENDAIVAIASDCNPGSSFTENMQIILSLSVINMRMTAEEALSAATINGAFSLELSHRTGSLEVGKDADFVIIGSKDYSDIFYHFGINQIEQVSIKGEYFESRNFSN